MSQKEMRNKKNVKRSFVLSPLKFQQLKERFEEIIENVPHGIKIKAGSFFFNPFRSGIYFSQVQSLYLLGCNEYHSYVKIENKIKEILKEIIIKAGFNKDKNKWDVLCCKCDNVNKKHCKDERGKIQHNFTLLQRMGEKSPYGYKLAQVHSCIDIIENRDKLFEYRLNTQHSSIEEVKPFYTNRRKVISIKLNILKKPKFIESNKLRINR